MITISIAQHPNYLTLPTLDPLATHSNFFLNQYKPTIDHPPKPTKRNDLKAYQTLVIFEIHEYTRGITRELKRPACDDAQRRLLPVIHESQVGADNANLMKHPRPPPSLRGLRWIYSNGWRPYGRV